MALDAVAPASVPARASGATDQSPVSSALPHPVPRQQRPGEYRPSAPSARSTPHGTPFRPAPAALRLSPPSQRRRGVEHAARERRRQHPRPLRRGTMATRHSAPTAAIQGATRRETRSAPRHAPQTSAPVRRESTRAQALSGPAQGPRCAQADSQGTATCPPCRRYGGGLRLGVGRGGCWGVAPFETWRQRAGAAESGPADDRVGHGQGGCR